jgi:hypothetical protein
VVSDAAAERRLEQTSADATANSRPALRRTIIDQQIIRLSRGEQIERYV